MIKHIEEIQNFNDEVLEKKDIVLVDFFATWCGPCNMLSPVLENISNTRTDFSIAKIDVDKMTDLAVKYEVEVVPTLIIFKNGEIMERFEGFVSEEEILNKIGKYK